MCACSPCVLCVVQHRTSVDMNIIPEYAAQVVTKTYSLANQQALLLAWSHRFQAFCTGLQATAAAAVAAGAPNVFTAGQLLLAKFGLLQCLLAVLPASFCPLFSGISCSSGCRTALLHQLLALVTNFAVQLLIPLYVLKKTVASFTLLLHLQALAPSQNWCRACCWASLSCRC